MNTRQVFRQACVGGMLALLVLAAVPAPAAAASHSDAPLITLPKAPAKMQSPLRGQGKAYPTIPNKPLYQTVPSQMPMRQKPITNTQPPPLPKGQGKAALGNLGTIGAPSLPKGQGKAALGNLGTIGAPPLPKGTELGPAAKGIIDDDKKPAEFEPAPGAFETKGGMALPGSDKMEEEEEEVQAMPSPGETKGVIFGGGPGPGPTEAPLAGK
jgi:hypothetical protein